MIELLGVLVIIGIAAGISVYRVNYWRYRMDGNVRFLQNFIVASQQVAIRRNVTVRVMADQNTQVISRAEFDGASPTGLHGFPLAEGARFVAASSTIPGFTADGIMVGPGADVSETTTSGCAATKPCFFLSSSGQVLSRQTGSSAGDVVIHIGSPRGIPTDLRAVQIIGATARAVGWSNASGSWRRMN